MKWQSVIVFVLLVASIIGLADATYLTVQHYRAAPVVCEIGGTTIGSCEGVLGSKYATAVGIPVSLIGVLYYLIILIVLTRWSATGNTNLMRAVVFLTGAGFVATLWFVYLQLFVLNAICLYCMISALCATILFMGSTIVLGQSASREQNLFQ